VDILSEKKPATKVAAKQGAGLDLARLFKPIASELAEVDRRLTAELTSEHRFVDQMLQHTAKLSGKRLRPALLLLAAKALGEINEDHLTLAVVIEMIHTATLVHDDVLDGAEHRRHLPTVSSLWGNESSVLVGDFLFSRAFYLASGLQSTHACREIGSATNIVCEGEMRQIGSCTNFSLVDEEYRQIIEAKTATLCATAAYLGARYCRSDHLAMGIVAGKHDYWCERFRQYGRLLGIAFQIIDDVLDVTGEEQNVGKSLGTDLQQCKPTLPLIHLLGSLSDIERQETIAALSDGCDDTTRFAIRRQMQEQGSIEFAQQQAIEFAGQASALVQSLPDSQAAIVLRQIPQFIVNRQH
jgi:octaprenyl-diphosphate synthase